MNNSPIQLKEALVDSRFELMMVLSKMVNHSINAVHADEEVVAKISELEVQIGDLARQMQELVFDKIDEVDSERN